MKNRSLILTLIAIFTSLTFTSAAKTVAKDSLPIKAGYHYEVNITTSEGQIRVKLHNETPIHRDNFVKLAKSEFYTGILFHRVIKNFVIQAGDPSSREGSEVLTYGNNDSGYLLPAEVNPKFFHKKGTLAAARNNDDVNPERKSSGSQFYIVIGQVYNDSTMKSLNAKMAERGSKPMTAESEAVYRKIGGAPHLDGLYTIFGEVVSGQNVVDKINAMPTYRNDRPKDDVFIKKMTVSIVKDKKTR